MPANSATGDSYRLLCHSIPGEGDMKSGYKICKEVVNSTMRGNVSTRCELGVLKF